MDKTKKDKDKKFGDKLPIVTPMEKAIYGILRFYGTDVLGRSYKLRQQTHAICQLMTEMQELQTFVEQKHFRFVRVIPIP